MKNLALLNLLIFLMLIGCTKPSENATDSSISSDDSFPKLLDRPEKLWYGKEWETIQNTYAGALHQIRKKDNPEAYLRLCEVFINEARVTGEHGHYYPSALEVLDVLEKKKGMTADIKFQLLSYKASVLLSQHEFKKALKTGQEALKLNNYNAQIYGILVDANVELGNYSDAIAMADKMVSIRPDLRSYSRISYLREIHGDFEGAIEAMNLAVAAGYPGYEQSEWTRLTLGKLYETTGNLDQAALQYQTILDNRENYPFAIAALANIEVKKGNFQKAEQLLKTACAIIPEVSFHEQLAMLYKKTGENEKVEKLEIEIFDMLWSDVESGHNMNLEYAKIYLNMKNDPKTALKYVLKEYELRPKNIDVNKAISAIYFQMNDIEKAEKHLQIANQTHSKNPELLCLTGLIDIANGHKESGVLTLKKAFEINPFQSHSLAILSKNYM
jgi:tetratricopeptide (TPR) repeat protein